MPNLSYLSSAGTLLSLLLLLLFLLLSLLLFYCPCGIFGQWLCVLRGLYIVWLFRIALGITLCFDDFV